MKGLAILFQKELREQLRTNRIIIVAGVFLLFGLTMPLMTKYLPEILEMSGVEMGPWFPLPTATQAMADYASNIAQIGTLVIILIAMGAISKERESGTAALVLSKPVDYSAFVTAKFIVLGITTVAGVILGGLACWVYTIILFPEMPTLGFLFLNMTLLLYLLLTIAITLFFSGIFRNQLVAGGLSLATIIVFSIASGLPWVGKYLPGELISWGNRLLSGETGVAWEAVAVAFALIVLSLYLAWTRLRTKEI